MRTQAIVFLCCCATGLSVRADTVYWESGNVWDAVRVLETRVDAEGVRMLIRDATGETAWWTGIQRVVHADAPAASAKTSAETDDDVPTLPVARSEADLQQLRAAGTPAFRAGRAVFYLVGGEYRSEADLRRALDAESRMKSMQSERALQRRQAAAAQLPTPAPVEEPLEDDFEEPFDDELDE